MVTQKSTFCILEQRNSAVIHLSSSEEKPAKLNGNIVIYVKCFKIVRLCLDTRHQFRNMFAD